MKKMSLKNKMIIQSVGICLLLIMVFIFSSFNQREVASSYRHISTDQFPKLEKLSHMIAKFRLIRIKVRTLGVYGNTQADQEKYIQQTKDSINDFVREEKGLKEMEMSSSEKEFLKRMDAGWNEFLEFGNDLMSKYENPTDESIQEGARMIREVCPLKATKWMSVAEEFLVYQRNQTETLVDVTLEKEERILKMTMIVLIVSSIFTVFLGILFARNVSKNIQAIAMKLLESAKDVAISSNSISVSSAQLSESSIRGASSLQETVSSIDEISAMIQRNADAASNSTEVSSRSKDAASRGKRTVESMIDSIGDISRSNEEIAEEMNKNNDEISKIVQVISEIGDKTKVINDIVFQTKLLSFNASVEAARAGEHGKGFAVVAEEVGNLASMSGKAALEISELLDTSIDQVTGIVENTKKKVEILVGSSKEKVEAGTRTAIECGEALDQILHNVNTVNEMVNEISSASREQSAGVKEVSSAMQLLDQTTHENTEVAQMSSSMSKRLKNQANDLNDVVKKLMSIVSGSGNSNLEESLKLVDGNSESVERFSDNESDQAA